MDDMTMGVSCDIYGFLNNVSMASLEKLAAELSFALRAWADEENISLTVPYITDVKKYDLRKGCVIEDD